MVNIQEYAELNLIAWSIHVTQITEQEAFALYEANWRFVDAELLTEKEAGLILVLKDKYGNGVLNV